MGLYVAEALGDGNCAFNAWILGLFKLAHEGKLEEANFQQTRQRILEFVHRISRNPYSWKQFKAFLDEKSKKKN